MSAVSIPLHGHGAAALDPAGAPLDRMNDAIAPMAWISDARGRGDRRGVPAGPAGAGADRLRGGVSIRPRGRALRRARRRGPAPPTFTRLLGLGLLSRLSGERRLCSAIFAGVAGRRIRASS